MLLIFKNIDVKNFLFCMKHQKIIRILLVIIWSNLNNLKIWRFLFLNIFNLLENASLTVYESDSCLVCALTKKFFFFEFSSLKFTFGVSNSPKIKKILWCVCSLDANPRGSYIWKKGDVNRVVLNTFLV